MEDKSLLLQRLHQLESEIEAIKNQLEPPKKSAFRYPIRFGRFVLSNWTLVAFLCGLLVAIGVYLRYDISYFESPKTISLTKKSAESYRQLGDRLMLYGEFDAAKDAYRTALKINPSNTDATRGLLTTQILEPQEGQKFIIPEVATAKLEFLKELVERDEQGGVLGFLGFLKPKIERQQGYIVDYFEGQLNLQQGEDEKAIASFEKSVHTKPEFIYGYMSLFQIQYERQDFDRAIEILKRTGKEGLKSALVLNGFGDCYLINGDFAQALTYYESSNKISHSFLSMMNLAEAHRYRGEAKKAIEQDQNALQVVEDTANENERILGGGMLSNFMPEKPGEKPPKYFEDISSTVDKRTWVYYTLSLDYALAGEFVRADEAFGEATKLDLRHGFNEYIANRILSLEHFSGLRFKPGTLKWMERKQKALLASR